MADQISNPPDSPAPISRTRLAGRGMIALGGLLLAAGYMLLRTFADDISVSWAALAAMIVAMAGTSVGYLGVRQVLAEAEEPRYGFVAWARLAGGAALTLAGVAGRVALRAYSPGEPAFAHPELFAFLTMALICGPVLMAWAGYSTFVADKSQMDTGFAVIGAFALLLIMLLHVV